MAGQQPRRNLPAAPNSTEICTNAPRPRALAWVWAWWPAIAWAVFIFVMSTDTFSAQHTASFFEPILRWLRPGLTQAQFRVIHHIIRKCAHFAEYFVFCLLLYRAVRGEHTGWRRTWAITTFFLAGGYSVSDELHQVFVASRGPSAYDSLLDSSAALVALVALWLWLRVRHNREDRFPT